MQSSKQAGDARSHFMSDSPSACAHLELSTDCLPSCCVHTRLAEQQAQAHTCVRQRRLYEQRLSRPPGAACYVDLGRRRRRRTPGGGPGQQRSCKGCNLVIADEAAALAPHVAPLHAPTVNTAGALA